MSVIPLLRRAASLPPHVLLRKAWGVACREFHAQTQRRADELRASHALDAPVGDLFSYIGLRAEDVPDDLAAALPGIAARVLDHRFDQLGSGWTAVHHGVDCTGVEGVRYPPDETVNADRNGAWLTTRVNVPNVRGCRRLWRLIENPHYRPIDWQLDFKSGWRWSEKTYFSKIAYGDRAGADVKMPWELARMQHLPWLAVAGVLARAGRPGFAPAETYAREVRDQILDFLATNPPRFGVNWGCPMDVGIRVANWLLALDILRGAGVAFDVSFKDVVTRTAYEHGRHIAAHLEWSETGRSNHYLSDIVGLLFVAAYMPRTAETDAWLAFSIRELEKEIATQFGEDGGNYEGSTAYHCLSAELAVYGAALVLGLTDEKMAALGGYDARAIRVRPPFAPAPLPLHDLPGAGRAPLSPLVFERLRRMADFLAAVTKPDGRLLQVGDTDSGRLFKLHPVWRGGTEPDEDALDRRALSGALGALVGGGDDAWLDARVVRILAKARAVPVPSTAAPTLPGDDLATLLDTLGRLPDDSRRVTEFLLPAGADRLTAAGFADFGLFVLRGPRLFVSLRCAGHEQTDAPSGHTHDDNLAMDLQIDGRDVIVDPGSYLYTAFPEIRERYRGIGAHFAPRPAGRCAVVPEGLFALRHLARATCIHCGPAGLAGRIDAPDWHAWRVIKILPDRLRVTDACDPGPLVPVPTDPPPISDGYGKRTANPAYSL
jgi:Heparinase II/III N-terminus/Heparinase II/III-like protein